MKTIVTLCMALVLTYFPSAHGAENQDIDFNSLIPNEVKAKIFGYAARDTKPGDLRLVCRNWENIIDQGTSKIPGEDVTYKNIGTVWKQCIHAWYGVTEDNQEILQKFLNTTLVYKPNKNNEEGMIELKILDLPNPFSGRFDLSKCGGTGNHIAIMTGFREEKMIGTNKDKVEIWISPGFLIEKFRESTAKHFEPILEKWDEKIAPLALFYSWGNWDNLSWYEYLTNKSTAEISNKNFYDHWLESTHTLLHRPQSSVSSISRIYLILFHISIVELK